jgi:hypothetical protein
VKIHGRKLTHMFRIKLSLINASDAHAMIFRFEYALTTATAQDGSAILKKSHWKHLDFLILSLTGASNSEDHCVEFKSQVGDLNFNCLIVIFRTSRVK